MRLRGLYDAHVMPRLVAFACGREGIGDHRRLVVPLAEGHGREYARREQDAEISYHRDDSFQGLLMKRGITDARHAAPFEAASAAARNAACRRR